MLNQGILGEGDAISCIVDICNGLDYAWESRKIIHRDVKPDNIFITNSGKAKLMGFGIAKSGEGQSMGLTGIGFTIGTPEYMSPEQIKAEGGLDFHTDMYSLGCVLYQTITGRLPFDETAPILLMQKHMDEDPVPANEVNPEISQGCTNAIAAMMAKDPEERPENWEILVNFLKEVKAGGGAAPQTQEAESGGEEAASGKKGKFGCGGMLAFAACAVVGLGTVLYSILC
jgi:serine/threonine protein kinase